MQNFVQRCNQYSIFMRTLGEGEQGSETMDRKIAKVTTHIHLSCRLGRSSHDFLQHTVASGLEFPVVCNLSKFVF